MSRGAILALSSCALWALGFIAPVLVRPAGALELTLARYTVFGLCSVLVLAVLRFNPFKHLSSRDWWRIIGLGLTGNTLYFVGTAAGVGLAGPAPATLVAGVLPMVLVVAGNHRRPAFPWRVLAWPLGLLAAGLAVTTVGTLTDGAAAGRAPGPLLLGLLVTALGVASWAVYGVWNSEYVADHPGTNIVLWASLTGLGTLVTLPLLLVALLATGSTGPPSVSWVLVVWGLVLGIGATWLTTWLWATASRTLSVATLGILVVSETVFGLIYSCLIELRLPNAPETTSTVLIVGGVVWGLVAARPVAARRPEGARGRQHA